jgi:hypothetical protein
MVALSLKDTGRRRDLERPFVSSRYGLVGKTDYLVETANGLIPVELKSRDCARSGPYASDAAQLTAYCVLVEPASGRDRLTESFSTLIAPGPYATPRKTVSEFWRSGMKCAQPAKFRLSAATISTRLVVAPAVIEKSATRHLTEPHPEALTLRKPVVRHFSSSSK